jgi:acyl-CoA hydrolase
MNSIAATAAEAVAPLRSGMNVFVHGASATPTPLLEAMIARPDLENITLYHLHTLGPASFAAPEMAGRFRSVSFFAGANVRTAIKEGRADFIPVFLSDIPRLFHSGAIRLDAALLQLSPPDSHGCCSLGTSVDAARAAADTAPMLIAEINARMPRTHGNSHVHQSKLTRQLATNRPLLEHPPGEEDEISARIGEYVAELVEDGSTIQAGIGSIPDAVLARLKGRGDLGIHTEMFSDRVVDLVECGAVTNRRKRLFPGRLVTSFITGSQRLFDFADDNALVEFLPCDITNDTNVLRKLDRLVAINSALQVDLTGQICADSLGPHIYSGIGGQLDFIRGAALSAGGKPILALPSTAKGGSISRIVNELSPGAGVVTTRGHVHWVVTEYGAVNLHGMTLRQRGEALISIAHPDFRGSLAAGLAQLRHFPISLS